MLWIVLLEDGRVLRGINLTDRFLDLLGELSLGLLIDTGIFLVNSLKYVIVILVIVLSPLARVPGFLLFVRVKGNLRSSLLDLLLLGFLVAVHMGQVIVLALKHN